MEVNDRLLIPKEIEIRKTTDEVILESLKCEQCIMATKSGNYIVHTNGLVRSKILKPFYENGGNIVTVRICEFNFLVDYGVLVPCEKMPYCNTGSPISNIKLHDDRTFTVDHYGSFSYLSDTHHISDFQIITGSSLSVEEILDELFVYDVQLPPGFYQQ